MNEKSERSQRKLTDDESKSLLDDSDAAGLEIAPTKFSNTSKSETISILECFSCGAKHDDLPINELNCGQPPYTHWYTCPTSGDPAHFTIGHIDGKRMPMNHDVMHFLNVAHGYGKYIVAIGYETSPKDMIVAVITEVFTTARFEEFVETIRTNFRESHDLMEGLPDDRPQPVEGTLKPMSEVNLWSGDEDRKPK